MDVAGDAFVFNGENNRAQLPCLLFVFAKRIPRSDLVSVKNKLELLAFRSAGEKSMKHHAEVNLDIAAHLEQPLERLFTVRVFVSKNSVKTLPQNNRTPCVFQRLRNRRTKAVPFDWQNLPAIRFLDMVQVPGIRSNVGAVAVPSRRN